MSIRTTPPDICPVCGAEVPPKARACPECGADDSAGWNEDRATYDGLDLPGDEFDYNAYLEREFGEQGPSPKKRWPYLCVIGAILVLITLLAVII